MRISQGDYSLVAEIINRGCIERVRECIKEFDENEKYGFMPPQSTMTQIKYTIGVSSELSNVIAAKIQKEEKNNGKH